MSQLLQWLSETAGIHPEVQGKLLASFGAVLLVWLIRWGTIRVVERKFEDSRQSYHWRKTLTYAAFTVTALVLGRIWIEGFKSLTTFLGLLSAGLAIALKDLLINLAGWLFIVWRRPFEVGDRIHIGTNAGDVIDLRIFQFTLLEIGNWVNADQSTGRVIHIPNGSVFTQSLANYDKGFRYIWNEVPVLVTFESDWKKAKTVLQSIADRHGAYLSAEAQKKLREASRKFMIFYTHLTPTVYTSVKDCGVLLTIRYLCEPRRRRGTEQAIWEDVLEEFSRWEDIDFAYPTQRFFNHLAEGKSGLMSSAPSPGVAGFSTATGAETKSAQPKEDRTRSNR